MKIKLQGALKCREAVFDPSVHVELTDGFYHKRDYEHVVVVDNRYYRRESPLITHLSSLIYGANDGYPPAVLKENAVEANYFLGIDYGTIPVVLHKKDASEVNVIDFSSLTEEQIKGKDVSELPTTKQLYYRGAAHRIKVNNGKSLEEYSVHTPSFYNSDFSPVVKSNTPYHDYDNTYRSRGVGSIQELRVAERIKKEFYDSLGLYRSQVGHIYRKKDLVLLSKEIYGKEEYAHKKDVTTIEGHVVINKDILNTISPNLKVYKKGGIISYDKEGRTKYYYFRKTIKMVRNSRIESRDFVNESLKDLYLSIFYGDGAQSTYSNVDADFEKDIAKCKFGFNVAKAHLDKYNHAYDVLADASNKSILSLRARMSKSLWDFENATIPKVYISGCEQDTGGDYVFYQNKDRVKESPLSPSLAYTGGIGYTFGVEIETSYGVLPIPLCSEHAVNVVGDRSIGSLEYVTPALHGTKGIKKVKALCNDLADYTAVDDRCGVHIHVGGMEGAQTPSFNRRFSILAIMLGCQIEKELFSLMPDNRMEGTNRQGLRYCDSILKFADTNFINGRSRLRQFVFGGDSVEFDRAHNSRSRLSRWTDSRYKWLNLVNCNTDNSGRRGGGFKTIEFRAFNGTVKPDDIHAYILISLAFVSFIENRSRRVKQGGVTMLEMLKSTLNKTSYRFMEEWISQRAKVISDSRKLRQTTKG